MANAPAVDASLIAYLWPLFIVLLSALFPGERLHWYHISGAVLRLCGAAVLGFITHGVTEIWVMPDTGQWLAIVGLGLGPVGAAFFVWDYGTKHGDIQALGVASYGAPLLSTILLIAFSKPDASPAVITGCLLIVGGELLASIRMLRRKAITAS